MMKRLLLLTLILLITSCFSMQAQYDLYRLYRNIAQFENNGTGYYISDHDTTADGNIIVTGSSAGSVETANTYLLKLDPSGQILWSANIGTDRGANSVSETMNGEYLLTTTYSAPWVNWDQRVEVIRVNATGQVLWDRSVGLPNTIIDYDSSNRGVESIEKPNGNILTLANSTPGLGEKFDILVYGSTSAGVLQWGKKMGTTDTETGVKILPVGTEQLIVGTQTVGSTSSILVFRIDDAGTVLWSKLYGNASVGSHTAVMHNGNVIIGGASGSGVVLVSMDANGNLNWAKEYEISGDYPSVEHISPFDDGGMLLSVYINSNPRRSVQIRTDMNGDTLWTRTDDYADAWWQGVYEFGDTTLLLGTRLNGLDKWFPFSYKTTDIQQLDCVDPIASAVGQVNVLSLTVSVASLPETAYGNDREDMASDLTSLASDSVMCQLVYVGVNESGQHTDITLYPNPATATIRIQLPEATQKAISTTIYDMQGRLVMQQPFTTEMDVSTLSRGTYAIVVQAEEGNYRGLIQKE